MDSWASSVWAARWARRPARPLPASLPRARGPPGPGRPGSRVLGVCPSRQGPVDRCGHQRLLWDDASFADIWRFCERIVKRSQGHACAPFLHGLISQRQIHCSNECLFNWRGSPESGKNLTTAEPDHGANQQWSPVPAPRGK
ncbi:hypothetical protein GH733_007309 [Mirounga leonina]|nr:hypothetical protein GH733_007309 [Mirounga leonina]